MESLTSEEIERIAGIRCRGPKTRAVIEAVDKLETGSGIRITFEEWDMKSKPKDVIKKTIKGKKFLIREITDGYAFIRQI